VVSVLDRVTEVVGAGAGAEAEGNTRTNKVKQKEYLVGLHTVPPVWKSMNTVVPAVFVHSVMRGELAVPLLYAKSLHPVPMQEGRREQYM
jgi:hypothetical protein